VRNIRAFPVCMGLRIVSEFDKEIYPSIEIVVFGSLDDRD
jgi:hypothetical protein